MARFRYTAYDRQGDLRTGIIEASDETDATGRLRDQSLTPTSLTFLHGDEPDAPDDDADKSSRKDGGGKSWMKWVVLLCGVLVGGGLYVEGERIKRTSGTGNGDASTSRVIQGESPAETVHSSQSDLNRSIQVESHSHTVSKAPSAPSEMSVTVIVKDFLHASLGNTYKYSGEYRLYADDELIATKTSKSPSMQFKVRVRRGAQLRAQIDVKNAFGATAELYEPWTFTETVARNPDETIVIECH